MNGKRLELIGTIESGKIAARYHLMILLVLPVLGILKITGLMGFSWTLFAISAGLALLSMIGSVAAVGMKPLYMIALSTLISASTILLVHRDGVLILIFPILIAMLYSDIRVIRWSFGFSVVAYILVEGLSYYYMKEVQLPGLLASGIIMLVQLLVLLSLGLTLVGRMQKKLESERVFMESISELLANAKDLADEQEVRPQSIMDKVKNETMKILKYNRAIAEMSRAEEKPSAPEEGDMSVESVNGDISLLLSLADKLHTTVAELEEDLGKLTGALGGISEIIQDAKEMGATAAVEEVAMKEKDPEISEMAERIGKLAYGAKEAAEKLAENLREIGKDGENAVQTVDKTYEAVYTNLELINRNVEMLLRWVTMKKGSL